MATTFIVTTALKLAAMGGLGIGLATGLQYFLNFDWKPSKKAKGDKDNVSESLNEKARQIG